MRHFLLAQTTKLASTSGTILGNRGYLPNKRFRRTTKATLSVIACVLCLSFVLGSTAYAAELVADSTSYEIGSTVTIEGFSFEPGETVTVAITELDGTPITGPGGEPWTVTSDGIGDFSTTFVLDYEGTSEELLLNAVGETSGLTASTTFLVPPTNLDQLQNGTATSPPEWSNGNINGNNSCYSEGRSVPYRAFISNTTAGTSHYFTIEMDWTRATIHAIDYLTSYDITEDSAIWLAGGPCGDSGATAPDGCSVPTDSLVMPDPTDSANYSGTIPPDFFTLVNTDFVYDVDQYLMANNAIIDSVGDYRFGGTASNTTLALEVYFTTDTTGSVGVFWGGHLAEGNDDGWGIGNGSASITGAPYHMQIRSLDGGGVAAQSASIQNGTICLPPSPLIVCDVDTVCADTFSTYVCYDTSSAGDWLWSVTNGTIIGDNTLDSVVFYVTPGVNPGETVTVQLTACNVDGGCPGDVCCTDVSMTLPVISCNNPPEVYCADPVSFFLCELEEICLTGFSCYDSDDNLDSCYVNMGVLSGDTVCFTPTGAGVHEIILTAVDAYNQVAVCTTTVTVTLNSAPVVSCPSADTMFVCDLSDICVTGFSSSDVDNNLSSCQVSLGTLDGDSVCFTPVEGVNTIEYICIDSCGLADTCEVEIDVVLNSPPVADAGADQTLFQCTPTEICWAASYSDPDGNETGGELVSGPGTYDGSDICFTPSGSGSYLFVFRATDACSETDDDSVTIDVTINSAPTVVAQDDTSLFLCTPQEICVSYVPGDPDGLSGLTETMISGYGSIDTANNEICFTPTSDGVYEFTVGVTDDCTETDQDVVVVTVTFGDVAEIDCPTEIFDISLCDADSIIQTLAITPDSASVSVSYGIYDEGAVRFLADTAGIYVIKVIAAVQCGADTCEMTFDVEIGQTATISCPDPQDIFLCAAGNVSVPVSINGSDVTVTVSPIGTYDNGTVIFPADTSGHYEIKVLAETPCGDDSCTIEADITINSAPVADDPGAAVDTFMCAAAQICYQFGATDVDGGPLTWTRISGAGTVDASGNWCFDPTATGSYTTVVAVEDSCEVADTVSHTYNVDINSAPIADDPGAAVDTFMCAAAQICYQFGATDVDGGPLTWVFISGAGTVDASGNWCFDGAEGSWTVTAEVTDSCGATDTVSHTYNVDINSAPVVTLDNDTTIILCDGSQFCFGYEVTDDDNNVTLEQLMAGTGTLDTVANEICFTPTSAGVYSFTVRATDSCGAYHEDTIEITVEIGTSVVLTCPDPLTVFLCAPETICRPVGVTPSDADVVVSPIGTYAAGEVCFMADTAGFYELTVIATSPCGADTCSFTVDVTLNSPPIADDPGTAVDTFMCATDQICYQFGATDIDGGPLTWTQISGAGTVDVSGNWCFDANATGSYTVVVAVEDSCEVADTTSKTYNVTLNSDPTIVLGNDTSLFLCAFTQICFDYIVADADNNIVNEECLVGGATMDTVANTFCFVPDTVGTYRFILRVTDSCGASDTDTIDVIIGFNSPPIADAGEDIDLFHCDPSEVCFPVSCSDPDDNLDTCYIVDGPGLASRSDICFTPDTSGVYQFILRALDECGEFDDDTILVTVTLNTAPVCELPNDSTFFQCVLAQVSLPVGATDIDGNFDSCEIVSGPGSIVGGFWVYTPAVEEVDTIVIRCYDSCQASCEGSFIATFTINSPPVADAGDDAAYFFCEPGSTLCWPASCSDPDDNLVSCNLISAHGTYDSNDEEICFQVPSGDGSYIFVMEAVDACGLKHYDTATISVVMNHPPTIQMEDSLTLFQSDTGYVCFYAEIFDEDGNLNPDSIIVIPDAEYIEGTGICFTVDTAGWYVFEVYAGDSCGAWASDSIFVEIEIENCIHTRIEKVHDAYQGRHTIMNVYLDGVGKALGGFDLLLAYDETALLPGVVEPGQLFESCGWEYFAYRYGDNGNCGNACPSGLLRIVGIAETNNGPNHPGCYLQGTNGILATVDFLVTNDRTYECQFAPVSFFWADCNDNSFSSQSGDILYVSRSIYTFELYPIHDYTFGVPGYFGVHDSCLAGEGPDKPKPERCVDFTNGGIDIICADSIDARGDMNLNGIAYEVADAVVYANYFIYGLSAFSVNVEGQIAASDVNADGLSLTVGDMVYLIRVVVGDAPPVPKLDPNAVVKAEFAVEGDVVSITKTDLRIGAIFLLIDGQAEPSIHKNANSMEMSYHYDGTSTRVLIYDMSGDSYLESGPIMHLNGRHTINSVEVGGYDGLNIVGKIDNLPESFTLSQNYPNPFNPTTTIKFALPIASEWELTIYNILGNQVEQFNGKAEAGYQELRWDAVEHSSGVYFYRLKAGGFTASKRMVLLK